MCQKKFQQKTNVPLITVEISLIKINVDIDLQRFDLLKLKQISIFSRSNSTLIFLRENFFLGWKIFLKEMSVDLDLEKSK